MASPALTPAETEPKDEREYRFPDAGYPSEWAESYRPGGFHPVNLGDRFKDGRYEVIRKLGYGSYSTVWLAWDSILFHYVALKIMTAKSSSQSDVELSILHDITEAAPKDPRSTHIMKLLDKFQHSGPNGTHLCLVFEPMGPTTASLAEKLPQNQHLKTGQRARYPKSIAKMILKHTLLGLAFLHERGIVHADLQPGNLLFALSNKVDSMLAEELAQDQSGRDQNTTPQPLKRLDGKEDIWAPQALYLGQSLHEFVLLGSDLEIKISDFGAAFYVTRPPPTTITPVALRAPELIFNDTKLTSSIDIWSFGCLVYEFLTGTALFCVTRVGNSDEEADDEHLLELNDVLGKLPDDWMKSGGRWKRAGKYFGKDGERLNPEEDEDIEVSEGGSMNGGNNDADLSDHDSDDDMADDDHDDGAIADDEEGAGAYLSDAEDDPGPWINSPLETLFSQNKPDDIDDAEAEAVTRLIRRILKYEPAERPCARELLEDAWFKDKN